MLVLDPKEVLLPVHFPTGEAMRRVQQFRHGAYYQIGRVLTQFPFNVIASSGYLSELVGPEGVFFGLIL